MNGAQTIYINLTYHLRKMPTVSVYIREEIFKKLAENAARENISISKAIANIVQEHYYGSKKEKISYYP